MTRLSPRRTRRNSLSCVKLSTSLSLSWRPVSASRSTSTNSWRMSLAKPVSSRGLWRSAASKPTKRLGRGSPRDEDEHVVVLASKPLRELVGNNNRVFPEQIELPLEVRARAETIAEEHEHVAWSERMLLPHGSAPRARRAEHEGRSRKASALRQTVDVNVDVADDAGNGGSAGLRDADDRHDDSARLGERLVTCIEDLLRRECAACAKRRDRGGGRFACLRSMPDTVGEPDEERVADAHEPAVIAAHALSRKRTSVEADLPTAADRLRELARPDARPLA